MDDIEIKKFAENRQCAICRKKFDDLDSLIKHLEVHYDCPICNQKLKDSTEFVYHMGNHLEALKSDFPVSFYIETLLCFVCRKKFTNPELFSQHLRNHEHDIRAIGKLLNSIRKKQIKKQMTAKDWLRWEQQIQDLKNIHKAD